MAKSVGGRPHCTNFFNWAHRDEEGPLADEKEGIVDQQYPRMTFGLTYITALSMRAHGPKRPPFLDGTMTTPVIPEYDPGDVQFYALISC